MLSKPRPEYGGMVLGETFGNFAFAIASRVLGLRDLGPALSPFNAFMILTGIETLPLRMQRHCDNALAVAKHLAQHPAVEWVSYPGLDGDKYHALAKRYSPKGAGAVFTFGLKGGYDAGVKLVSNLKLFSHLANIGDTRSLVIHPASTTHRQLTRCAEDRVRRRAGSGAPLDRPGGRPGHHRRPRPGPRLRGRGPLSPHLEEVAERPSRRMAVEAPEPARASFETLLRSSSGRGLVGHGH